MFLEEQRRLLITKCISHELFYSNTVKAVQDFQLSLPIDKLPTDNCITQSTITVQNTFQLKDIYIGILDDPRTINSPIITL